MPKFAANLSLMFAEYSFLDRFGAAARAGFKGVEYLFPYDHDPQALADTLRANKLQQVLHNLPAGNWAAGERGIACHPDRVTEFQDGVGRAIEYANALGCGQLNCLAGKVPEGVDIERATQVLVDNLTFAASQLAKSRIRLLLEPINRFDIPGFLVGGSAQAMTVIDAVGSDNLFLQYDIYHMQRAEGELAGTLERLLPRIAHMQLADNPGRHEPGTGEINYPYLFRLVDRLGYDGWIGCEYIPAAGTEAGLGWMAPGMTA